MTAQSIGPDPRLDQTYYRNPQTLMNHIMKGPSWATWCGRVIISTWIGPLHFEKVEQSSPAYRKICQLCLDELDNDVGPC